MTIFYFKELNMAWHHELPTYELALANILTSKKFINEKVLTNFVFQ